MQLLAVTGSVLGATKTSSDEESEFTCLGRLGVSARIVGLSADGGALLISTYHGPAYVWNRTDGLMPIPGVSGLVENRPRAISSDGSRVVGTIGNGKAKTIYRWSADHGTQLIIGLPHNDSFAVNAISPNATAIVGWFRRKGEVEGQPGPRWVWVWTEDKGFRWSASDGPQTPRSVSDDGELVFCSTGTTWSPTSGWGKVPWLPSNREIRITKCSPDGSAMIGRMRIDGNWRPVCGSDLTGLRELLPFAEFPENQSSTLRGQSSDGRVSVGYTYEKGVRILHRQRRAFVCRDTPIVQDLEQVLNREHGLSVHPWGIYSVDALSADGQVVAGISRYQRAGGSAPSEFWIARCQRPIGSPRPDAED